MHRFTCTLVATVAIAMAGCASTPSQPDRRVFDVRNDRWITPEELARAIAGADYVLLGETHDNRAHHAGQLELLTAFAATTPKPALALEQFDLQDQGALDRARAAGADAEALGASVVIAKSRWDWPAYKPLVAVALEKGLPINSANLSRADARKVAQQGLGASPEAERFARETAWTASTEEASRREIRDAHCGKLPEAMVPGMVAAQRARDALMAQSLLKNSRGVLIAGRGHVRNDRGVPLYIKARAPQARVVSVAFVEHPEEPEERAAFDYVWPMVATVRPDPCAAFTMPPARTNP